MLPIHMNVFTYFDVQKQSLLNVAHNKDTFHIFEYCPECPLNGHLK
jgi:hypothetical protein